MAFGQFKLVAVGIADPGAKARAVGALFERANKGHTFFFKNRAELAQVAGIDADVNVGRHLPARALSRSCL